MSGPTTWIFTKGLERGLIVANPLLNATKALKIRGIQNKENLKFYGDLPD
jgi:hypothetical protein